MLTHLLVRSRFMEPLCYLIDRPVGKGLDDVTKGKPQRIWGLTVLLRQQAVLSS